MRRPGVSRFIIALFGLRAIVVLVMFALLLVVIGNLHHSEATARRSSDLLAASNAAERSAIELDDALRGFLLTRDRGFARTYDQLQAALPGRLQALMRLTETDGSRREATSIAAAVGQFARAYTSALHAHPPALGADPTPAILRGQRLLAAIETRFGAFNTQETVRRAGQRASVDGGASLAVVVATVGFALTLLLLGIQLVYMVKGILLPIRRVGDAADRLRQHDFAVRVPENTKGEVARLGASFNEMARTIQSRDAQLLEKTQQLEQAVAMAEEASMMKSTFLANMSHEIRTPLNGLVGMISLLSETPLNREQREYIEAARTSSEALMTVVNDVLDIAKIEAGRLDIERSDFDLRELIESSCEIVAPLAAAKGLELQSFVHEDVPAAVLGDRARMGQILSNLLSNAVKFTLEGEVAAEVSVVARDETATTIRFEVRDTGIGIDPERLPRLFEPFTQADVGTTRRFGGTGLGLTISRQLAQLMGGRIEARSEPGLGSTFLIEISFTVADARRRDPVAAAQLRGMRVLVVDDNATNRQVFEAYLRSWQMSPETATDAEAAFENLEPAAARGQPFDLALLDLNMPSQSGLDLARRIKASQQLSGTPLILLTSTIQAQAGDSQVGFDAQVTKPVRQSRLLDAIARAMARRASKAHPEAVRPPREEASPGPGHDAAAAAIAPSSGKLVLVAEDQPVNWLLIERLLAKRGHGAEHAEDGEQALRMLEQKRYDLVLMDCQMPIRDGYATALEIRRREAATGGRVPIVAMTANAMRGDRERCLAAGMDDYLAKPITAETLDEKLTTWLDGERSEAAARLDSARLGELRSLFEGEELEEMLHKLDDEIRTQLDLAIAAARERDLANLAAAAHRLKGSAQLIGLEAVAEAAADFEQRAREGHAAREIDETLERLAASWAAGAGAVDAAAGAVDAELSTS